MKMRIEVKKGLVRMVAVLGAATLGLSVAACGNANTADSSNSSTPTVSFMLDWTPNTNHIGLYVAQKLGYFKDAGVNVKILPTAQAGAETSVENGVANVGFTTLSNVAAFNSQGSDLKTASRTAASQNQAILLRFFVIAWVPLLQEGQQPEPAFSLHYSRLVLGLRLGGGGADTGECSLCQRGLLPPRI